MSALLAAVLLLVAPVHAHDLFHEVEGSGTPGTETRAIPGVTSVATSVAMPVTVTADGREQVFVTCDDNLVHLIETEVDDDALRVRLPAHTSVRPLSDCRVEVSVARLESLVIAGSGNAVLQGEMPGVRALTVAGSGELSAEAIRGDELAVTVSGSGDVILAGSARELAIDVAGSGDIDAIGLLADQARVTIAGSGDIDLFAREAVDVSIVGSGDVRVHGSGVTVRKSIVGGGDVTVVGSDG